MTMLCLHNSLTGKIEPFKSLKRKAAKLYTCGPTVYSSPHIGNYRTYVWEDVLKRYLIYRGYKVKHVMNITDYDNAVLRESKKVGTSREKLVKKYERIFMEDLKKLNILPADHYPRVSSHISQMANLAKRLAEKGFAYKSADGKVFFDISRKKDYGKLIGKTISSERKIMWEQYPPSKAGDFIIWVPCTEKNCKDGFRTSLGKAHPPWNIQCAAISTFYLGEQIDLAMGGTDNKFNHHENTRAIAEAAYGKRYAKYWVHIRHLIVNGEKMSKSKGNAIYIKDLQKKGFPPRILRFLLISTHYRKRLNFTWKHAEKTKRRYLALRGLIERLNEVEAEKDDPEVEKNLGCFIRNFEKAMDRDLNVPKAIGWIESFLFGCKKMSPSKNQARKALMLLRKADSVLACLPI